MIAWTIRSFFAERMALVTAVGGVAVAFLLVLITEGMFVGEASQIVAYLEHSPADVWVMQDGVANMHMATSFVDLDKVSQVRRVPGVAQVVPMLYFNAMVQVGERRRFAYIIGLPDDAPWGGAWQMASGKPQPGRKEAVVPEVFSRVLEVRHGGPVEILEETFTVVGFSAGTFSMANSIVLARFDDLEELLETSNVASYLMVASDGSVADDQLAERIAQQVDGVTALPRRKFIANDRALAIQMGGTLIAILTVVGGIVAALVVAWTVFSFTVRLRQELAVIKAVGARPGPILGGVVLQSVMLTMAGYTLAVGMAVGIEPFLGRVFPEVAIEFAAWPVLRTGVAAIVVGAAAALVPAYRAVRVDPVTVFQT